MTSVDYTNESFACQLRRAGLMPRYVFLDRQAAVETLTWQRRRLGHTPNSNALLMPYCAKWATPVDVTTTTSRFAFDSEEELSKLAERVALTNTAKTIAWALNNFQQWMAIIIVTLLHIVHV